MPAFVVEKVAHALNDDRKPVNGSRILVLGVAYKRDIDDMRESPALDVIRLLEEQGAHVSLPRPVHRDDSARTDTCAHGVRAHEAGNSGGGRRGHRHGSPGGRLSALDGHAPSSSTAGMSCRSTRRPAPASLRWQAGSRSVSHGPAARQRRRWADRTKSITGSCACGRRTAARAIAAALPNRKLRAHRCGALGRRARPRLPRTVSYARVGACTPDHQ